MGSLDELNNCPPRTPVAELDSENGASKANLMVSTAEAEARGVKTRKSVHKCPPRSWSPKVRLPRRRCVNQQGVPAVPLVKVATWASN